MIKYIDMPYEQYRERRYIIKIYNNKARFIASTGIMTKHVEYIVDKYLADKPDVNSIQIGDIGCRNGFMQPVCKTLGKQIGVNIDYIGLEIHEACADYAQEIGRNVIMGNICERKAVEEMGIGIFDIVMARQIMQFMPNIKIAMINMMNLLKVGGLLQIIQTIPYKFKEMQRLDKTYFPHHYNSIDTAEDILRFVKGHKVHHNGPMFFTEQVLIIEKVI